MSETDQTGVEYHARQRANAAENEAGMAKQEAGMAGRQLSEARRAALEAREHLEKALALLDQDADQACRDEMTAALRALSQLHL
jgi:predicted ATPase